MRLRQALLSILVVCISSLGSGSGLLAANVTLQGLVLDSPSSTIRVLEYSDYISFREREIAQVKLSPDGRFKVNLRVDEPGMIMLAIENFRGRLFVEPSQDYELEVKFIGRANSSISYISTGSLDVRLLSRELTGLNSLIGALEYSIDSFITKDYERIYLRRDRQFVRHFVDSLAELYQPIRHSFFETYLEYSLGYLEYMGNLRSWESLRLTYFRNRKLEFHNPAYMDLFSAVFEKYFLYYSKTIKLDPLIGMVNSGASPDSYYNQCMSDTLFHSDPALAELVVLLSVSDMFHVKDFRKEAVFSTLQALKPMLRFTYSKLVAINLLDQNASMIPGLPAPAFQGLDLNREKVELRSYKGKTVLLIFWDSSCPTCRDEFNFIAPYLRTKADSLVVVTANVDRSFDTFSSALKSMPAGLEYLYTGQDLELMESYRLSGLPLYILIDPRGDIIENPTVSPGGDPNHFLLKVFGIR
jgi:thiol-disulfide isomerase/thioredoxin